VLIFLLFGNSCWSTRSLSLQVEFVLAPKPLFSVGVSYDFESSSSIFARFSYRVMKLNTNSAFLLQAETQFSFVIAIIGECK
jgi:hypothetical protein